MARKGKFWKANIETTDFILINAEPELEAYTKLLQKKLNADVVAIDILEESDGNRYIVEYNDIPGLSGFPEQVKYELANCMIAKVSS